MRSTASLVNSILGHVSARGAWRDLETATVSFDDSGQMVSRNVTLQTEILETVAEGKYVLKVQATVELGGKRIVGDWKKTHAVFGNGPCWPCWRVSPVGRSAVSTDGSKYRVSGLEYSLS